MKIKPTPFLLAAGCFVLVAAWIIIAGEGGNLVGLFVIMSILAAALFFGLYYVSYRIFKDQFRKQFIVEFILVIMIAFAYYRQNEKIALHIPRSYRGHILVVYGVANQPKLETRNLLSPVIDINVPSSGIIYTSSAYGKKIVLVDSSTSGVKMLKPGYGIPFSHVTLPCRGNRYATDIIVYGKLPPGWNPIQDTEKRSRKLGIACELLSRDMH